MHSQAPPPSTEPSPYGLFGIMDDYSESFQSLDERFVKNKASTFFFQAQGESMAPLIQPKDILIVDRSMTAHSGCVIVLSLDGKMLCKRLIKKDHHTWLQSENSRYKKINLHSEQNFILFGVVRAIARDLL